MYHTMVKMYYYHWAEVKIAVTTETFYLPLTITMVMTAKPFMAAGQPKEGGLFYHL